MSAATTNDTCPSCGVAYPAHLGVTGTCAKLQAATKEIERLTAAATGARAAALEEAAVLIRDLINDEVFLNYSGHCPECVLGAAVERLNAAAIRATEKESK